MRPRGRPKKVRIISTDPEISQFSPRGKPGRPDEVGLTLEEFEALRYADLEVVSQKEAAQLMNVSQPTFSRVLKKARQAVAEAIICGKRIKVAGGTYKFVSARTREEKDRHHILELTRKFKDKFKTK